MSLKTIGIILIVVGIVIALVAILADSLFGGGKGVGTFGTKQILGTVGGIVIVVIGAVAYWRESRK